jgi:hypothetical protein
MVLHVKEHTIGFDKPTPPGIESGWTHSRVQPGCYLLFQVSVPTAMGLCTSEEKVLTGQASGTLSHSDADVDDICLVRRYQAIVRVLVVVSSISYVEHPDVRLSVLGLVLHLVPEHEPALKLPLLHERWHVEATTIQLYATQWE